MSWEETFNKPSLQELQESLNNTLKKVKRKVNPYPLSPEMLTMFSYNKKLVLENPGRICARAPANMIGALIIGLHNEQFLDIFNNFKIEEAPSDVTNPYSVINNVPLYYYDSAHDFYQRIGGKKGLNAEKVLIKHIFGDRGRKEIGAVIKGPLSGLILDIKDGTSQNEGMCINRMWNDYDLSFSNYNAIFPGHPNITKMGEDIYHHAGINIEYTVIHKFFELVSNRSQFGATRLSELFFYLCRVQGINIDTNRFHTTSSL